MMMDWLLIGASAYILMRIFMGIHEELNKPKRKRKQKPQEPDIVEQFDEAARRHEMYSFALQSEISRVKHLENRVEQLRDENIALKNELSFYYERDRLRNTAMPTFPHLYSGNVRIKWDDDSKP